MGILNEAYTGCTIKEVENIIHNSDTDLWSAILLVMDKHSDERCMVLSDNTLVTLTWDNLVVAFNEMGMQIDKEDLEPCFNTFAEGGVGSNDEYYVLRSE